MCGIVGFTNNISNSDEVLGKMMDRIKHRGPAAYGKFIDDDIALGHRRLSIIDVSSSGDQPIFNEDGSIVIVFNGEIYNSPTLREELEAWYNTLYRGWKDRFGETIALGRIKKLMEWPSERDIRRKRLLKRARNIDDCIRAMLDDE